MSSQKLDFLINKFPDILRNINPDIKPQWGKMNLHQMIEHMIESVREANGKTARTILTPQENLPKMKAFLMSEKEFRPNTKNQLMGEEPSAVTHATVMEAISTLETELKDFIKLFEKSPQKSVTNPFFGELNFAEWTQMLHKHAIHHLKQFGFGAF